jgi:hypothetical protein
LCRELEEAELKTSIAANEKFVLPSGQEVEKQDTLLMKSEGHIE